MPPPRRSSPRPCCVPSGSWPRRPGIRAVYKGAIVVDAASGQVLFEDHADEVSPPASMTKLMTFAVLDDRIRQRRPRPADAPSRSRPPTRRSACSRTARASGSGPGEVFPVEELIYAMMIQSANDAAYALAHAAAGSVPAFVDWMNAKARALGMSAHDVPDAPTGCRRPSRRIADGDLTTPARLRDPLPLPPPPHGHPQVHLGQDAPLRGRAPLSARRR